MLKIGDYNDLRVGKEVDFGLYLQSGVDEILLPTKYIPEGTEVGDIINVFIYTDSEDRLIATNLTPKAKVGDIAGLIVKDVNKFGAFMDWGLEKDLFVPFKEQQRKMEVGRKYVVKVLLDPQTNRIIGTSKLGVFLEKKKIDLEEGEEVNLLIYDKSDLGYAAAINKTFSGILYHNEIFKSLEVGDEVKGFIKQIRPDNKIDLTLNKGGRDSVEDAKKQILSSLRKNDGFLPLNDDSSPEEVKQKLQMSKKIFKKAIGGLYKEKIISLSPKGIFLITEG